MSRAPKLFSPAEMQKVEAYRSGRKTLYLTFVASEIAGHTELREPVASAARKALESIAVEHIEKHFGGSVTRHTATDVLAVYADPVSAMLGTEYLHARIAGKAIANHAVRLSSGIDIGSVAPPRIPISDPAFHRCATRALQTLEFAKRGAILVTEDVIRRLCGRLDRSVTFLAPEKRSLIVEGKESKVTLYTADGTLLPATMPSVVSFPRASITLYVRDEGTEQQYQFDADRDGNIFVGAAHVCHIALKVAAAAPHHARIILDEMGNWVVDDAESQTGTYLNQQLVKFGMMLKQGDVIQIGRSEIWVQQAVGIPRQPPSAPRV